MIFCGAKKKKKKKKKAAGLRHMESPKGNTGGGAPSINHEGG